MTYQVSPLVSFSPVTRELARFFQDGHPFGRTLVGRELDDGPWSPSVDITEDAEAFRVVADLPGVDPASMDISLHQGVLTLRGNRSTAQEVKEGSFTRRERVQGAFVRQFSLPDAADEESISARSNNGVLEIILPKAKQAKPISIKVERDLGNAETV